MEQIKSYFGGVGNIWKQGNDSVLYNVTSLQDLTNVIIPHFDKYSLITQKKGDFILFKEIIDLMNRKEHLTLEGIQKILAIKASMNWGLSDQLTKKFPKVNLVSRPIVVKQTIKDPYWLAGFITGESNFTISIFKSTTKTGYAVRLIFRITQHYRDIELMKSLVDYLGCGRYVAGPLTKNHGDYIVSNLPDIVEKNYTISK